VPKKGKTSDRKESATPSQKPPLKKQLTQRALKRQEQRENPNPAWKQHVKNKSASDLREVRQRAALTQLSPTAGGANKQSTLGAEAFMATHSEYETKNFVFS